MVCFVNTYPLDSNLSLHRVLQPSNNWSQTCKDRWGSQGHKDLVKTTRGLVMDWQLTCCLSLSLSSLSCLSLSSRSLCSCSAWSLASSKTNQQRFLKITSSKPLSAMFAMIMRSTRRVSHTKQLSLIKQTKVEHLELTLFSCLPLCFFFFQFFLLCFW